MKIVRLTLSRSSIGYQRTIEVSIKVSGVDHQDPYDRSLGLDSLAKRYAILRQVEFPNHGMVSAPSMCPWVPPLIE